MMLHSASRTGLLSHIYDQRQKIAYRIGIIPEIPIAICNDDYDFGKGLLIDTSNNEDSANLPPSLSRAPEIILFFQSASVQINIHCVDFISSPNTLISTKKYTAPGFSIFHPPA
ncbi:MAG: hypothetical protein ABIS36_08890 [Chryseolinea sp.]